MQRLILHVDMDAFYASVEQFLNPNLKGSPVAVGGSGSHAVVSAASYEARAFGVHSAMPLRQAVRLCPGLVILPVRMNLYRTFSKRIMAILLRYTPEVEPVSLDEAFLDVTGSCLMYGRPFDIASSIKNAIKTETGLTASIGSGPNKFVAKLASSMGKPDGLIVVSPDDVIAFISPLPIEAIPGVGKKTSIHLHSMGINTIGQIRISNKDLLKRHLGSYGGVLWDLSHGIDMTKVEPFKQRKSISHEVTLDDIIYDIKDISPVLAELSLVVGTSLRALHLFARCVQVKFRYKDFSLHTRQTMMPVAINGDSDIFSVSYDLIRKHCSFTKGIRLIGVTCSYLSALRQSSFYDFDTKVERLYNEIDKLRARYGMHTVVPGVMLYPKRKDLPRGSL